ncbi:hypothetical protein NE865_11484 [Phthorimaea operculella]|nr:hypothetical protein NE865_11484 [Phthorimaea operculella]
MYRVSYQVSAVVLDEVVGKLLRLGYHQRLETSGPTRRDPVLYGSVLSEVLQRFWESEEPPTADRRKPEDDECELFYQYNTARCPSGRFVTRLPFLPNRPALEYGIINMEYCSDTTALDTSDETNKTASQPKCTEVCPVQVANETVCGVMDQGTGVRARLFANKCEMAKHNCKNNSTFTSTDELFICNDLVLPETEKPKEFADCTNVCPAHAGNKTVCGIRILGKGVKARLFRNECDMKVYNCQNNLAFNATDDFVCDGLELPKETTKIDCSKICTAQRSETVCGIREQGKGFKARLFENECEMLKYNCETNLKFNRTDDFVCADLVLPQKPTSTKPRIPQRRKNIVVVDADMFDNTGDINQTIDNFFSGTHMFDVPVQDVSHSMNASTRRVLMKLFGPVVVFKPWIHIPKKKKNDTWHLPLINSCYHKCPMECPDVYAPVCGNPGKVAREPRLMFQNHCMMDAAQCRMKWENASPTAKTSEYIESTFVFCLGLKLYGLYRFLPLVRTLQHMGRLKKKSNKYHMRLQNQRYFNERLQHMPKLMG